MPEDVKKARLRSPAYPAIGLKEAIERAKALYERDKTAVVPMDSAAKHIGFAKAHGQALMFLSALRKFGLVEYPSDGRVSVTRRAVDIFTFSDNHERKLKAVRDAVLHPALYLELFEKYRYSGLPSDEAIGAELIADRGFNPTAVGAFLKDFRESLEYAGLLSDGVLSLSPIGPEATETRGNGGGSEPSKVNLFSGFFNQKPSAPAPPPSSLGVKLMEGERIVFTHEIEPSHGVRILATGEVDESLLDALELYVQLQKKRLERESKAAEKSE